MAVSDRILAKTMEHALEASRKAREQANKTARAVEQDSSGAKVCAAHNAFTELVSAQLSYIKALGEGLDVIMESAIVILNERAARRGLMTTLTIANFVILAISVLVQILKS